MTYKTRTTIQITNDREVTLNYVHSLTGEIIQRVFDIPFSGGCIREGDAQVCEYLNPLGKTLTASNTQDLLNTIRREWKRRRQAGYDV